MLAAVALAALTALAAFAAIEELEAFEFLMGERKFRLDAAIEDLKVITYKEK